MIDAILAIRAESLKGDERFGADVQLAMRMIRTDVMLGHCELPPWLTAHLDACQNCGGEKSWMSKSFDGEWVDGHVAGMSGQSWHGCKNCSQVS